MVKNFIAAGAFLLIAVSSLSCTDCRQYGSQFGADSVSTDSVAVDSVTVDSMIQESQMEVATCEPSSESSESSESSSSSSSSYSSNPAMDHIRTQRNYNAYRPYKW